MKKIEKAFLEADEKLSKGFKLLTDLGVRPFSHETQIHITNFPEESPPSKLFSEITVEERYGSVKYPYEGRAYIGKIKFYWIGTFKEVSK